MAELLQISKSEAMSLVDRLGIDWMDYDPDELTTQLATARKHARP